MALHVERVPLTSARKATKVLQLCQRFQLREQGKSVCQYPASFAGSLTLPSPPSAQSVCRVLAMREFRSGRLGAAMSWCLQAKDSIFAAFLAEKSVQNSCHDTLRHTALISSLQILCQLPESGRVYGP